jgi:hypothetical protein
MPTNPQATIRKPESLPRRDFLALSAVAAATAGAVTCTWAAPSRRPKVAAIFTEFRLRSHAYNILSNLLGPCLFRGQWIDLGVDVASFYADQFPENDMARDVSRKYGIPLFGSIDEALCLGGQDLTVDGVLIIGEHGDYPADPKTQQVLYPRRKFFDAVADVFRRVGEVVPVFNDKHLSAYWSDARAMYDAARELRIPFMAGSSIPVMWRKPSETIPLGSEITEAVALGYGGLEAYGFHTLEGLQCLVERRKGGETGVKNVQAVRGDGIPQAEQEGRWSKALFDAVVEFAPAPHKGTGPRPAEMSPNAVFYLIDYLDGTKATVAMETGFTHDFVCGVAMPGRQHPFTVTFVPEEERPYGHFEHLLRGVERMIQTGQPAYPVERTLLTTGVLDAALHSWADGGRPVATPHLAITYVPADWPFAKGDAPGAR